MATKRKRPSGSWEYIIKRKGVLPKPLSLTFEDEAAGDDYVARLEKMLDAGIVPDEFKQEQGGVVTIGDCIRQYIVAMSVPESDRAVLKIVNDRIGTGRLLAFDYETAAGWVTEMKQKLNLSPSTIRHHVGALARCLDWAARRKIIVANPLRLLPKRYATYNDADAKVVKALGMEAKEEVERDRRLSEDEEADIRRILAGEKPEKRERPFALKWQGALECLFTLALESGMRLREMYTLGLAQVDFSKRTIFLEKTKNGSKRQVPLSTIAEKSLRTYLQQVEEGGRGMAGFAHEHGNLFPWWNGDLKETELRRITTLLSRQYARVFDAAGCGDFTFHGTRHEFTCRLYQRTTMKDVEIAKILGWKSLSMALRYGNLRGSDLASRIW